MENALIVVGSALLALLTLKLTDFLKAITNGDINAVITQAVAWGGSVGALFLFRASQLASTIQVTDTMLLSQLNGWTTLLVGVLLGSGGSAFYDLKQAIGGSASTRMLVPPLPSTDT